MSEVYFFKAMVAVALVAGACFLTWHVGNIWFSGVMAVAMLLCGVAVYFGEDDKNK